MDDDGLWSPTVGVAGPSLGDDLFGALVFIACLFVSLPSCSLLLTGVATMPTHTHRATSRRHFFKVVAAAAGAMPFVGSSSQASGCGTYPNACPVCFLLGTRILTAAGEVAIEELAMGDLVKTRKGEFCPVKWVGRQKFKNAAQLPGAFLPVCITRHALDENTPNADLYVSPSHCLYVDGFLIPADHLVNGTTIVQALPNDVTDIEYLHIELDTHEVIFAQGTATETLLVTNERGDFDNFIEYERLYGTPLRSMTPDAPIICYNGGRSELKALARRIAAPLCDIRDPVQVAFDRIAARAASI